MQLYRPILKQSLNIIWRHKLLWFFGFFVGLLGSGDEYNLLISKTTDLGQQQTFLDKLSLFAQSGALKNLWDGVKIVFTSATVGSAIALVLSLVLAVLLIFLFITAQITLIRNTKKIQNKESMKMSLKYSFMVARIYFWKALSIDVIYKIIAYLLIVILSIMFLTTSSGQNGPNLLTIILFIILVPLILVISFITRYALCYLVLEKQSVLGSIKNSVALFFKNWLISIEMAFMLFIINILIGLALMIAIIAVALPFILLISLTLYLQLKIAFWVLLVICLLVIFALIVIIGSALSGFQYVGWTLLFIQLVKNKGSLSKLIRLFSKHDKKIPLN